MAHERGQRKGKISRRLGEADACCQLCIYPHNFYRELYRRTTTCEALSKYLPVRRSRKRCTAFLPIQSASNPSVKKSKPPWPKKAGRKLDWTKCTRSTVSCER